MVKEKNDEVSQEVTDSYKAAKKIVDPFFSEWGGAGTKPYCEVSNETRGEIVQASYRYRDALLEAQKTLYLAK